MTSGTNIIDAALRFARSNPDVLARAREGAACTGRSVDELLSDAIARMRCDGELGPPSSGLVQAGVSTP